MTPSEQERLERLERQVDYLFRHFNISPEAAAGFGTPVPSAPASALPPEFYDLLQRRKMIQAIKMYRAITGVGLKEAKDAVDAMARNVR